MSGTPEIFAVNAIVPETNADKSLPDGAIVTDNVSIISTYSSLEVCRTPGRRHGMAGPVAARDVALFVCIFSGFNGAIPGEDVLQKIVSHFRVFQIPPSCCELFQLTLANPLRPRTYSSSLVSPHSPEVH